MKRFTLEPVPEESTFFLCGGVRLKKRSLSFLSKRMNVASNVRVLQRLVRPISVAPMIDVTNPVSVPQNDSFNPA